MILVDTSVWIDDVRRPNRKLRDRVDAGDVLSHDMVIGELACGNLPDRNGFPAPSQGTPRHPGTG